MGVFGKQGPYQEFKPLFVKEFDAKDTIKTLNAKYSELDALTNINKTPALTYEQQEADKIHAAHQEALNKSVDTGDLSPFKAITLTKGLAHSYANDADRLKYERSYAKLVEDDKTAGDNLNKVGASLEATDYHAFIGGSKKQVFQGYTPFKEVDHIAKAKAITDMINADSTEDEKIVPTVANGLLTLQTTGHKGISPEKVNFVAQAFLSDPEINGDYRNKSYAELSQQVKQQLLEENPNISEIELKAKTYQRLMTPVVFSEKVYKYEGKKRIEKTINRTMSPLEKSIEDKKRNALQGMIGAVTYNEWKNTHDFQVLPKQGDGADGSTKNEPLALGSSMDNFLDVRNTGVDELGTDLKNSDSSFKTLGQNVTVFAMNALKQAYSAAKVVGGTPYDPDNEAYRTNADNVKQAIKNVKAEVVKRKIGIDIPEVNADLSNIDDVYTKAELAIKALTSASKQQRNVPVIPVVNQNLVKVVNNLDLTSSEIVYMRDGKRSKASISEYIDKDGADIIPEKYTTSADKTKYISENLKVNNIQADGDNVYLRGSIGNIEVLLKPPFLNTNSAFQSLINFTKLTSSDLSEIPLPNKSVVLREEGHTKILKHQVIDDRTGEITYTYSLNGKGGTPPLNQTDFYNTYLQKEIELGIKGTQLKKLFQNLDVERKDYVPQ